MFFRWLAAHRSVVATITSGTVIAAVIATMAVISTGFTAQKMELDDGSVWVANDTVQAIGRANPQVAELNSVVRAQGADVEAVQSGTTVLLVDRANASLDVVDPTTSEAGDTIALPPERPEVWLAGQNVIIMAQGTGEVWITPLSDLQGFDPALTPTLTFGRNAVATVDPSGILYAYGPSTGYVYRVDPTLGRQTDTRSTVSFPSTAKSFGITAVNGSWAVLDATDRRIAFDRRTVDLSGRIAASARPVLQLPSAAGDRVLLAHDGGLLSVPVDGGATTTLVSDASGLAAAPATLGGCLFAAWSASGSWRDCRGTVARHPLSGLARTAQLAMVVNGKNLVLNDTRSGRSWAVQQNAEVIDNWDDLIKKDDQQQEQKNDEDIPPQTEQQQQPPVAVDDHLGARPGKATVLPVLLNDYDPNGDVLVISAFDTLPVTSGQLAAVNKNQQLLLTLPADARGTIAFDYSITDGRGGTASARVEVKVRLPGENSPPQQVRTSKTTVQAGGQVTTQVLGDWVDPDGDAMFLASATVQSGNDKVSSKADGVVLFRDSDDGSELKTVTLAVSDGAATGTGSLAITVRPTGQVPIIADPFPVLAYAGQTVTISPLEHVRGGNGTVRLNAVPAKTGVTIVPSFDKGTFTFTSDQVRTHYLEYVVTDGTQTVTGNVRVDVTAPPDSSTKPITIPKTVFVRFGTSQTVDVAGTDIDPAGGVLLVTGVDGQAPGSPIRAEVLEQRSVRVTLVSPMETPLTFGYRVSNGLAEADGTITVVQIPPPSILQPPIARDDTVTVRVGDVIDIPVLDNDEQPDGEDITLEPTLASPLAAGGGLLFVSGSRLRYLAPKAAGNYTAVYRISSAGQNAEATVHISVREKNASTNSAPVPSPLTARVLAGETVQIAVPLTGIDPDGDSVQLLGQASNPEKGTVLSVGPDYIEYQAGPYSAGTDSFTYSVMDGLGARATGSIRVGISARDTAARNPVAVDDEVTVRPGKTVTVQVLANDSDPDGSALSVTAVSANGSQAKAKIIDHRFVEVTPPATPGTYGLIYTIANEVGGTSSSFITVNVDPKAPLARPVANDTVLTVTDVLGKTTIDVPVLDNVFFADGPVSSLGVKVLPGYGDTATVVGKRVRVTVGDTSQIIPFAVTHPDDENVRGYAFIRVPGYNDALPQLNTKAGSITVKSEQSVTIDLNDYVVAINGGRIRLTDTASVKATHANGDNLVVDDHTLVYTSADQYFGNASISFEVTDGDPSDPSAHRATLALPIKVDPRDNQPPVFLGASLDFEPGEQKDISLVKLTNYPYAKDLAELQYAIADPQPVGFTYQVNGQRLVITANSDTLKGTSSSATVTVKDDVNTGQAGRLALRVVQSTRPLARLGPDTAIAPRGQTTTIDVLGNDQAGNPFPSTPLRVVKVQGTDSSSLPDGVAVSPSADRSRLSVTVGQNVAPGDINLQYQVADATNDPDRYVFGNVRVSIQDRPDPVTSVKVVEFGDRTLRLSWSPGLSNNAPITSYEVTESSAADGRVISTTSCSGSASCVVQTPGNGPTNAVRLSVVAINSIGRSDSAALSGTIWSDIIPPAPNGLDSKPLDTGLLVSWRKPDDGGKGSPITYYVVTVGGVSRTQSVDPTDAVGTSYTLAIQAPSIANGSATTYTVSARNSAPNSLASWNETSSVGTPAGPPIASVSPTASIAPGSTTASLGWDGAFSPNGRGVTDYWAVIYTGAKPTCTVTGVDSGNPSVVPPTAGSGGQVVHTDGGTTATFGGLAPNTSYSLIVFAYNGQGCSDSAVTTLTPRVAPPKVDGITTDFVTTSDSTWDFRLTAFSSASGSDADQLIYRLVGAGVEGGEHGPISTNDRFLSADGSHYGHDIGVQVKGCKLYAELTAPLCSADWSSTLHLGVPIRAELLGLQPPTHPDLGTSPLPPYTTEWAWTGASSGDGYTAVEVSCDSGATWTAIDAGPGTCTSPGQLNPFSFPSLQLRIRTPSTQEIREYPWQ